MTIASRLEQLVFIKKNILPKYDNLDKFLENVVKDQKITTSIAICLYDMDDGLTYVEKYFKNKKTFGKDEVNDVMKNLDIPDKIIEYVTSGKMSEIVNEVETAWQVKIEVANYKSKYCSLCKIFQDYNYNCGHPNNFIKLSEINKYIIHKKQIKNLSDNNITIISENLSNDIINFTPNDLSIKKDQIINTTFRKGNTKDYKYWNLENDSITITNKYFIVNCYNCDSCISTSNVETIVRSNKIVKKIKIPFSPNLVVKTPIGIVSVSQISYIPNFIVEH